MFPIICTIGPFNVYSYGLMLAIAIALCSYLFAKDVHILNIKREEVYDFVFWVVLSGVLGARIFFIILNWSFFVENPSEIVKLQNGGLAWQGSLVLGTIVGIWIIKIKKWPLWKFTDLAAPYIALGQAIGRLGCFLNGCCYGKHAEWGVYFPVHHDSLQPTQLYDSFGLLLIFFILKSLQKSNAVAGRIFIFYVILASMLRFTIEFFRADHSTFLFGLSIFQFNCLIFITIAYVFLYLKSRSR